MSDVPACVVDNQPLVLIGTGFRRLFLVNVYKAQLFAAAPVRSPEDLFETRTPLRIHFEYLYGPINRDRIAGAWESALRKAMPATAHADVQAFSSTISDYQRGDQVHYDLLPDGVVRIAKNGVEQASIASKVLRHGILDVMFGTHPVDEKLKAGLVPELVEKGQPA